MKARFLFAVLFLLAAGCFDEPHQQRGYYPSYAPAQQSYIYPEPYPPGYAQPYPPRYVQPEPQEWPRNGPRYVESVQHEEQEEHRAQQQEWHHEQQERHQEQREEHQGAQPAGHPNQGHPDND